MSVTQMVLPFGSPHEPFRPEDTRISDVMSIDTNRNRNDISNNGDGLKHHQMNKLHDKKIGDQKNSPPYNYNKQDSLYPRPVINDNFLNQYLRKQAPGKSKHQLYFEALNRERKVKLMDFFQKYLNQNDVKADFRYEEEFPSLTIEKSRDIFRKYVKASPKKVVLAKTPPTFRPTAAVPSLPVSVPFKEEKDKKTKPKILPAEFMECEVKDLIVLVDRMLQCLISLNDKLVIVPLPQSSDMTSSELLTRYHSKIPPSISIHTYLSRLTKFNMFTPVALLTTIYYIDLLSHHYQPYFTLNSWTVHRFLLVGTMVSQKLMDDFFYTNDHYAKVGGVAVGELNLLELDFLTRVEWKCLPTKYVDNKESNPRNVKSVLDLYYSRLIQMMGKNTTGEDKIVYVAADSNSSEQGETIDVDEIDFENDDDAFLEYQTAVEQSDPSSDDNKTSNSSVKTLKRRFSDD